MKKLNYYLRKSKLKTDNHLILLLGYHSRGLRTRFIDTAYKHVKKLQELRKVTQ